MNKYYYLIAFSVLVFSSMGLFVRQLSVNGLVAYFFAALLSCILFTFVLLKSKNKFSFLKKGLLLPFLLGLFGVIGNVTYFYAYKFTTIANATFIHYLAPPLVVLLAPLILKEKSSKKVVYSVIVALIGLFILIRPTELSLDNTNSVGMLFAFISALAYGVAVLLIKFCSRRYTSEEMIFSQMFFSVIILLPFILYTRPLIQQADIMLLLILGLVHQGIIAFLFYKALQNLPAQNFSIITYLEPVGAVILAIIFLSEIPTIFTIVGGALILLSCFITIKN